MTATTVYAQRLVDEHGSIVIFEGIREDGSQVYFAADHRPAQGISDEIKLSGEAQCAVPEYMILTEDETR